MRCSDKLSILKKQRVMMKILKIQFKAQIRKNLRSIASWTKRFKKLKKQKKIFIKIYGLKFLKSNKQTNGNMTWLKLLDNKKVINQPSKKKL